MGWAEKLGLLVGVALVVVVALVYYKPENGSWRSKEAITKAPVQNGFRTVQLSPVPAPKTPSE